SSVGGGSDLPTCMLTLVRFMSGAARATAVVSSLTHATPPEGRIRESGIHAALRDSTEDLAGRIRERGIHTALRDSTPVFRGDVPAKPTGS
ncbi:MAG: hypothetical protein JWM25_601, partial [Thermoleophilia bacterium]|nr:hypothetical protein [Thermoleophilia bacterium]